MRSEAFVVRSGVHGANLQNLLGLGGSGRPLVFYTRPEIPLRARMWLRVGRSLSLSLSPYARGKSEGSKQGRRGARRQTLRCNRPCRATPDFCNVGTSPLFCFCRNISVHSRRALRAGMGGGGRGYHLQRRARGILGTRILNRSVPVRGRCFAARPTKHPHSQTQSLPR